MDISNKSKALKKVILVLLNMAVSFVGSIVDPDQLASILEGS